MIANMGVEHNEQIGASAGNPGQESTAGTARPSGAFRREVFFVIGGASGLGAATVEALHDRGTVVVAFDRVAPKVALPGVEFRLVDVRDAAGVEREMQDALERVGAIDGFVYAAGVLDGHAYLGETNEELLDLVLDVNVKGAIRVARALAPSMCETGYGRMVFIGSIAGTVAGAGGLPYTVSKHALTGVVKSLALEFADRGITVNAIAPGAVSGTNIATGVLDQMVGSLPGERSSESIFGQPAHKLHPVGRLGTVDAIVPSILHLLSPQSWFITGTSLAVDGGYTAR
ncbi:SDR family oxidoreductase [Nakamurella silvestris]|nr:SDR family oxidoreductase [Nakamurella silvestris]